LGFSSAGARIVVSNTNGGEFDMVHPPLKIKWADGSRITVAEAARRIGISPCGLWHRLEAGVPRSQLFLPGTGPRNVAKIVAETGSPFRAAISGDISPEEYLQIEDDRKQGKFR
jgi:hypothetical protein